MNQKMNHQRGVERGFAIYEILLATVLVALITAAALPLLTRSVDDVAAKSTADDFVAFQTAAAEHFSGNRSAYEAAMLDGTGADELCKVGVNSEDGTGGTVANDPDLKTCAIDGSMLRYLQALPPVVRATNRYGESWVAVFRLVMDEETPPAPTGGVEMLVVSAKVDGAADPVTPDSRRYVEALTAAEFTGGMGGVIPDADRSTCVVSRASTKYEACGSGWRVNLGDFFTPAALDTFSNRVPN